MTDVSLDDRRTCFAVHWNVPIDTAREQFEEWGFHQIEGLRKDSISDGNQARRAARKAAIDRGGMYFWVGNYSWGLGHDSAVYEFSYADYDGPDGRLWDGAKQ